MPLRKDILARFSGESDGRPLYLPDLTLWYGWHRGRGTLPERWADASLPRIARDLGVPVWLTAQPWRVESPGVDIRTTEQDGERVTTTETSAGTLTARWTLGPDGAWWQTEYPVKVAGDLEAAMEIVRARTYTLDAGEQEGLCAEVGEDGVLAIEIPSRPYADLVQEFLGWSEGLMLLMDAPPAIPEMVAVLEEKLQHLVREVAQLPGCIVLSPDNLDGQFLSPMAFEEYLTESYRLTAQTLHAHDKRLLVHVGGPARRLLSPLAASGVDGVEGVAGPPQGDASPADAREIVGPVFTLWGGIPQEFLHDLHDLQAFEDAVVQAARDARGDGRMLLGVADRVPVDAELSRLEAIPSLIERTLSG